MTTPNYILYAEDDPDDQFIFREMIGEVDRSIPIVTQNNGRAAVDYLLRLTQNQSLPSLIVLDLNMPVMNGLDTLRWIKSSDAFKAIPVLMFSTSNAKVEVDRSLALGAVRYISKPNTRQEENEVARTVLQWWQSAPRSVR